MISRLTPMINMEPNSAEDFASAEIIYLKSKNNDLAKALSDSKVTLKQTIDERDFFQKELFSANLRNSELENSLKHIDQAARRSINAIVVSSNYITEIAQVTNSMRKSDANPVSLRTSLGNQLNQSPSKTQAVKPMIDGHVIYRPTISLRRVNEIPHEEIQRLRTSPSSSHTAPLDRGENLENRSYHRRTGSIPHSRSFNDLDSSSNAVGNDGDDVYTDQSSNTSDRDIVNNERLHTIEELSEAIMDHSRSEDDLSTIANASTNSLNISAHPTQGPLLSGVFRDVRVYLSPMQNVSEYLESLQNVATDRSKPYNTKKLAPKAHYSPRMVALDDNNQCIVTINSSVSGFEKNSNLASANNTFENSNNSILTSTRIGNNCDDSCHPRNSNYMKKAHWPSKFDDTTINDNMHLFNDSPENGFNKSAKWIPVKEKFFNSPSFPSPTFLTPSLPSTAYDPLEGPSTLLDTSDSNAKEKIETLSMLGLQPKSSLDSLLNTPSCPATSVLKRRKRSLPDSTPRKKKSIFVTKRKLDSKAAIVSIKVKAKRKSVPRLSTPQKKVNLRSLKRESLSPIKSKSLNSTVRKRPVEKLKRKKSASVKVKSTKKQQEVKEELDISQDRSSVSASSTITSISTKRSRQIQKKSATSTENESSKLSTTPPKSPRKKRPTRAKGSLKEPSLHKKMRRS